MVSRFRSGIKRQSSIIISRNFLLVSFLEISFLVFVLCKLSREAIMLSMFGGEEDEEKKAAKLEKEETDRQMQHALMEEEREKRRSQTRQKYKLKSKPRISLLLLTQNTPGTGSGSSGGDSRRKPFYQMLLCGACCR